MEPERWTVLSASTLEERPSPLAAGMTSVVTPSRVRVACRSDAGQQREVWYYGTRPEVDRVQPGLLLYLDPARPAI